MHQKPAPFSPGEPGRTAASVGAHQGLAAKLFPELATLAILLGLWLDLLPRWLAIPAEDTVAWLVAIEAATRPK